ncbi:MAG: hypothetical protein PWP31_1431 [Clostridia bacterium]|nr:hypothetical protein [Clostridia bacterium]MDK2901350.1 hypothetical protein [Thermosediminibacterales bacterium]
MEYRISKKELKIIDKDFRRYASRFLKTKLGNEINDLNRFLNYIESQPIIMDFINKNITEEFDMELVIKSRRWRELYDIPIEKDQEISWIYQFLKYCQSNVMDFRDISYGYGSGNKYQDHIDAFLHEVVKPFIDHITDFIGEVMIEMGYDEDTPFKIEISNNNGQINVSKDNSTINAINTVNIVQNDMETITDLADRFIELLKQENIDKDEKEMIIDDVEVIKEQVVKDQPRIPRLKRVLQSIKGLDGVLQKGTAIMFTLNSLIEQVEKFIAKF